MVVEVDDQLIKQFAIVVYNPNFTRYVLVSSGYKIAKKVILA